jgi:GDP-fucose transporter C1
MFSSAARSVLQTLLGVWIFSDVLTRHRLVSLAAIIGGTMYYTWIKSQAQPTRETPQPRDAEVAVPLSFKEDSNMKREGY